MMQDIEKLFQESLSNMELPYEAGAWEAMSARLGPPKPPVSRAKWYIAAAVVTAIATVATVASLNTHAPAVVQKDVRHSVATPPVTESGTATDQSDARQQEEAGTTVATATDQPVAGAASSVAQQSVLTETSVIQAAQANPVAVQGPAASPAPPKPDDKKNTASATVKLLPVSIPSRVCPNEPVVIYNPNAADLWVKLPGEEVKAVKGKQKNTFTAAKAGEIIINNGELTQKITVSQAASADIVGNDQLLYENGVPQLTFTTSAELENVVWSASVPGIEQKDGFSVHPYHENKVTIRLSGTDANGCKVQEERLVTIEEPYNLLAPAHFRPEGTISANQSFMPFALMQRDTPFELFIFDVKNGAQVFTTRDASKGWDGHDSRNGELVQPGSIWIWKVILKNPLPGEAPVYSGTITRL